MHVPRITCFFSFSFFFLPLSTFSFADAQTGCLSSTRQPSAGDGLKPPALKRNVENLSLRETVCLSHCKTLMWHFVNREEFVQFYSVSEELGQDRVRTLPSWLIEANLWPTVPVIIL